MPPAVAGEREHEELMQPTPAPAAATKIGGHHHRDRAATLPPDSKPAATG